MRILICGLGSVGQRHARNLISLGYKDLYALRVRNSPLPNDLKKIKIISNFDDAKNLTPNITFITNPTSLHIEYAIEFANIGSHLFIEKPLSHSLEGVAEFENLIKNKKLTAMVGYNFRFHPQLIQIKKILEAKEIGNIVTANSLTGEYLLNWHPKEDYSQGYSARADLGGGVILTQSHDIDYLCWLLGDVKEVYANAAKKSDLEIDVEDTAQILLKFKNEILGSLNLDYLQDPSVRQMTLIGTKGKIFWDYYTNYYQLSKNGKPKKVIGSKTFNRNDMFLDELKYFFDCIKIKKEPENSIKEGKKTVEVCLAVKKSARTGKKVVL